MQFRFTFFVLFSTCLSILSSQNTFNTRSFYSVMMGENIKEINHTLKELNTLKNKNAYMGALTMKKSGLLNDAGEKLKLFKEGRKDLETAISKDSSNFEYRFLRLLIQENAPKIVNYNSDIKKDAAYLRKNYKNLSHDLQIEILNYSKKSKELKPEDFKTKTDD